MTTKTINIDKLTIRVPQGWQGDPVMLARTVANVLQNHTQHLKSREQLNLSVQNHFAGHSSSLSSQLGQQLQQLSGQDKGGKYD